MFLMSVHIIIIITLLFYVLLYFLLARPAQRSVMDVDDNLNYLIS